jgi:hypothetical protein
MMRYHFYISDDKTHDNYFVQHCLLLRWEDTMKNGFTSRAHWIWSNNYSFQFKSKIPLYFVSWHPHLTSGFLWMWSCHVQTMLAMYRVPFKMPFKMRTRMNLDLMVITLFLHFLGGQLCYEFKRREHKRGGLLHLIMH